MIDQWVAGGREVNHFILTTLAPRNGLPTEIPLINDRIRSLAARRGVHLVDLTARTSTDNGASWSNPADHIGDGIHYSEAVRDWLGNEIVGYIVTVPLK
jgi:lysophospholipase L1-like esterase